ncbi:TPA: hypothetical protein QDZ12_004749 [Pseudomonas putida]|nr:hypothetical protein [Pseudomonas putida]
MSNYVRIDVDGALVALARFANGDLNMREFQETTNFESLEALSKTGMANFRVTKMVSGRYMFRWLSTTRIMPTGEDRLRSLGFN